MKRPRNNSNDDFDFEFGGSEEFFPLEPNQGEGSDTKPPKGVKGYLKNVVKSVKNLGVAVGKKTYPEAFEFIENILPKEDDEKFDIKKAITSIKSGVKEFANVSKNVGKSIVNDAKEAIKTGNYVKSEEEADAMAFGGDFDFGFSDSDFDFGDEDYGDSESNKTYSEFDTNPSSDTDNNTRLTKTIAKSSRSTAKLNMSIAKSNVAAISGAAQTQIKHDSYLFAQQIQISQEQHRQKMVVMKNIAKNLAKSVTMGNIALKAQMEFSAKSLAFAQDTAALIKEIRDVQWQIYKPKEKPGEQKDSLFASIFGNGTRLNKKNFLDNYSRNTIQSTGDGILGMFGEVKSMISMMTDMGMSKEDGIKMLIKDSIMDSFVNAITGNKMRSMKEGLNRKFKGLPGAINRKLKDISDNGTPDSVMNLLNKVPILKKYPGAINKISDFLQEQAGYAHVDDYVKTSTDRFKMTDPDKPHAFDNKAHKVLTEVIPAQLARIDAGINHSEEMYFNYDENQWKTKSSMREKMENDRKTILEYSDGVWEMTNESQKIINQILSSNDYKTSVAYDDGDGAFTGDPMKDEKLFNKNLKTMIHNLFLIGKTLDKNLLKQILYSFEDGTLSPGIHSEDILENTDFITDNDKRLACDMFVKTLISMRDSDDSDLRKAFVNLQISSSAYASELTRVNLDNEEYFSKFGSSIVTDSFTKNEQLERDKKNIERRLDIASAALAKYDVSNLDSVGRKVMINKQKKIDELRSQLKHINEYNDGGASINNILNEAKAIQVPNDDDMNDEMKYTMMSLKDSSTHGLINNIYNLLVDGVTVYPSVRDKDTQARYDKHKDNRKKQIKNKNQENVDKLKSQYHSLDIFPPGVTLEDYLGHAVYSAKNDINFYRFDYDSEKMVTVKSNEMVEGIEYFYVDREFDVWNVKQAKDGYRQSNISNNEDSGYVNSKLARIPIMGNFIRGYNKISNAVGGWASNKIGKTFYGEKYNEDGLNGDIAIQEAMKKAEKYGSYIKNTITTKEGFKSFKEDISDAYYMSKSYFEQKYKELKGALSKENIDKTIEKIKHTGTKEGITELAKKAKEQGGKAYDQLKSYIKKEYNIDVDDYITQAQMTAMDINNKFGVTGKVNTVKTAVDKHVISKVRNLIDNKLRNIKINGVTLGEVLTKISETNPNFYEKLKLNKGNLRGLCDVILESDNPTLVQFKEKILKIRQEVGTKTNGILNKMVGSKYGILSSFGGIVKGKFNKDREEGSTEDQAMDKQEAKEEQREEDKKNFLQNISEKLTYFFKHGLDLSKKTTKDIEKANEKGAAVAAQNGGGFSGMIDKILNKTGLGNTKAGKVLKDVTGKVSKIWNGLGKTKGAIGVSGAFNILKGIGKTVLGGAKTGLGTAGNLVKGASTVGKLSAGTGKIIGGALKPIASAGKLITKLVSLLLKNIGGPIAKNSGKIINFLIKNITKFAGRLLGRIASFISSYGSIIGIAIPIASAMKGFYQGTFEAEREFGLGKGVRVTPGMKLFSGLAKALDGLLMGIPGLISQFMGYKSIAVWLYEYIGTDAEKDAFNRYKKFNVMRATIFGITDPDKLAEFESRNVSKGGRAVFSILTFGLVDSNAKFESKLLGFKSIEIFKYWKSKKYEPLDKLRSTIAEQFGGLNVVEEFQGADINQLDKDDDNQIDDDQKEKYNNLTNQTEYRKTYLKAAADYVKSNKLAWLGSYTTEEEFQKRVNGKKTENKESTASKDIKKLIKNSSKSAIAAASGLSSTSKALTKENTTISKNQAKKQSDEIKQTEKISAKGQMSVIGGLFARWGRKIKLSGNLNEIAKLEMIWKVVMKNHKIRSFPNIKETEKPLKKIIKAMQVSATDNPEWGEKLSKKISDLYKNIMNLSPGFVDLFLKESSNFTTHLGVDLDKNFQTPEIKLATGMIGTFNKILPEANEACSRVYKKSLKIVIYEIIVDKKSDTDQALTSFGKFKSKRAQMLGVRQNNLDKYERILEDEIGIRKGWTAFIGLFSGGTDNRMANILGFEAVEIYKFWRAKKYDQIVNIENNIANNLQTERKVMMDSTCEDKDKQNKFMFSASRDSEKYINENGLGWLTYKTTLKEFEERRKNGTLSDKSVSYKTTARQNAAAENNKSYSSWDKFLNIFGAGNIARDRKEAENMYTGSDNIINSASDIDLDRESNYITQSLYKKYGYSDKSIAVMDDARQKIAGVWTNVDPTFYGDNSGPSTKAVESNAIQDDSTEKGGAKSVPDKYLIKTIGKAGNKSIIQKNTNNGGAKSVSDSRTTVSKLLGGSNASQVKYNDSISTQYLDSFGKKIIERLEVLNLIHQENIRHNKVSEDFFEAALGMMIKIFAKNPGNVDSRKVSELSNMMKQIVRN